MNVLDVELPKKKFEYGNCNSCKEKFPPLPYEVYGAIGGFFCEKCLKRDGVRKTADLIAEAEKKKHS